MADDDQPGDDQQDDRGWVPLFPGQRPPFQAGNDAALRHGGYSVLRINDRARGIAAALAPLVGLADRALLETVAIALARVEALSAAIDQREAVDQGEDPPETGRDALD